MFNIFSIEGFAHESNKYHDNVSKATFNKSFLKKDEETKMKTIMPEDDKINKKNIFRVVVEKEKEKINRPQKIDIKTYDKETQTMNFYEEEETSDEKEILEYLLKKKHKRN